MTNSSSKVGVYKYVIDAYLTDFRGKATLPMIGGFMLQAATKHAEERGFGYSYMTDRQRVWVLSRLSIELYNYPMNDTTFVLKTWVGNVNRLFTERYFAFEDSEGQKLGYAKSLWASIDIETRRPINVLELEGLVAFIEESEQCPIEGISKIPLLKDEITKAGEFKIKYSDIDINKHLNSMKYIEHFVDVFDIDMFREKEIERIDINYVSEGIYGAGIVINRCLEQADTYILEMKENDKLICSSRVKWK